MFPAITYPLMLPRAAVKVWMKAQPFEAAAFCASVARSSEDLPGEFWNCVSATDLLRTTCYQYTAILSLKNNWRTSHTNEERTLLCGKAAVNLSRLIAVAEQDGASIPLDHEVPAPESLEAGITQTRRLVQTLRAELLRIERLPISQNFL
jgi:hypothetical protein